MVFVPQLLTSERRPALKQELLGDRTQGESGQVFQLRDDSNHAEEEDDEKRPSGGKVRSVGASLFFSAADSAIARIGMVWAVTSRRRRRGTSRRSGRVVSPSPSSGDTKIGKLSLLVRMEN